MTDITQLTPVQRWSRAFRALARVVRNPEETDQVLVFSQYANAGTMPDRIDRFFTDPTGAKLYAEKRAIDSHTVDLDVLAALPEGTLGHAYATFLKSRGFTPEVFDGPPPDIADPRISYVIQRVRQTHDLWHVVTGHDTNRAGEVALQAFTYAQLRAPSTFILSTVGTLRGLREKPSLPRDVIAAFLTGRKAEKLIAFPWEDHWATPLTEVRAMLGLPDQPYVHESCCMTTDTESHESTTTQSTTSPITTLIAGLEARAETISARRAKRAARRAKRSGKRAARRTERADRRTGRRVIRALARLKHTLENARS